MPSRDRRLSVGVTPVLGLVAGGSTRLLVVDGAWATTPMLDELRAPSVKALVLLLLLLLLLLL